MKRASKSKPLNWFNGMHAAKHLGYVRNLQGIEAEKMLIKQAIAETEGNVRRAATLLDLRREKLYDRLDALQLRGYLDEQRQLANERRQASLSWIERTRKELCDGSDADDGGGVPGDDGGTDSR